MALDDGCVLSDSFFNNADTKVIYNDDFVSTVNYIVDSNNGCFYFKTKFTDYIMSSSDKIYFKFTISNALETIKFDVDENGIASSTSLNTQSKVKVISDFDIRANNYGGTVIIGFEIMEKSYRTLFNTIDCDYYCGDMRFFNVFSNVAIDMYVQQTEKQKTTTTKTSTTKSNNKNTTTSKKETTTKNTDISSSTKFTPSKATGEQSTARTTTTATTKFSPNGFTTQSETQVQSQTAEDTDLVQSDEEYWSEVLEGAQTEASSATQINTQNLSTSNLSKYIFSLGIIVIIAGVSILIVGLIKREKNSKNENNTTEIDNE